MLFQKIYYQLKPLIPRWLQIQVRRQAVLRKKVKYSHVWPIDENTGKKPEGWQGWPQKKQFALVLHHDVDTAKGHEKCHHLIKIEEDIGFRSSYNFVPERYNVSSHLRRYLVEKGFEVGVHGLKHDGKLFLSKKRFQRQAIRIRHYLKEWQSVGFVSPSMLQNLSWIRELGIKHDSSTFDTDPFEPQPDGSGTIFPFWIPPNNPSNPSSPINSSNPELATRNPEPVTRSHIGFVELPYTLPQDFTLFILMKERNIDIWKKKLDWIAEHEGMALLITHPDYMNFNKGKCNMEEYPVGFYEELLHYVKHKYEGRYWNPLPKEVARFWKEHMVDKPAGEICTTSQE